MLDGREADVDGAEKARVCLGEVVVEEAVLEAPLEIRGAGEGIALVEVFRDADNGALRIVDASMLRF